MFKIVLIALALHLRFGPMLERPPDLAGLGTWYGPPGFVEGQTMANGEPLRLHAPTVAVDVSHRDEWLNKSALVLTGCGGVHKVRITDTGYLYRAGYFRLGVRAGCLRYWSVSEPPEEDWELAERVLNRAVVQDKTHWLDGDELPVVADFPQWYFAREVACKVDGWGKGDTTRIWLWVLP